MKRIASIDYTFPLKEFSKKLGLEGKPAYVRYNENDSDIKKETDKKVYITTKL